MTIVVVEHGLGGALATIWLTLFSNDIVYIVYNACGLGGLRPPNKPKHNDVYTNAQCLLSERFAIAFSGIWEIKITIVHKIGTLNYEFS